MIELMLSVAIAGVLAAIAIPMYSDYRDRVNNAEAVSDIAAIQTLVEQFWNETRSYPDTLDQAGAGNMLDPWGQAYRYFNIMTAKGKGNLRKDKALNPINSDFDLYSMGKDGDSKLPLTPKVSHDDIIRARDGKFIGLASDF